MSELRSPRVTWAGQGKPSTLRTGRGEVSCKDVGELDSVMLPPGDHGRATFYIHNGN